MWHRHPHHVFKSIMEPLPVLYVLLHRVDSFPAVRLVRVAVHLIPNIDHSLYEVSIVDIHPRRALPQRGSTAVMILTDS